MAMSKMGRRLSIMKRYTYKTHGVCSREIKFRIDEGKIHDIQIRGGCQGNIQGLMRLVEGMSPDDVIQRLKGIDCGGKGTSCPDQLAKALEESMAEAK
jgi:uncharacterized protein (TIGR03905 family)